MGFFKKKSADPLSERERALSEEIAALESKIKSLSKGNSAAAPAPTPAPKLRSTTLPHHAATPAKPAEIADPIFETVDQSVLQTGRDAGRMSEEERKRYFNDLGVRKYDLMSFFRRVAAQFSGPAAPDSKLYKYLAVGSVQGLRPLRYERRVARNRFLLVAAIILTFLVGAILYAMTRHSVSG